MTTGISNHASEIAWGIKNDHTSIVYQKRRQHLLELFDPGIVSKASVPLVLAFPGNRMHPGILVSENLLSVLILYSFAA